MTGASWEYISDRESNEHYPAVSSLTRELTVDAIKKLASHGCSIVVVGKNTTITYPEGTLRIALLPIVHEPRYILRFQDGFELLEMSVINSDYKSLGIPEEKR
jgi:hypothetical protein